MTNGEQQGEQGNFHERWKELALVPLASLPWEQGVLGHDAEKEGIPKYKSTLWATSHMLMSISWPEPGETHSEAMADEEVGIEAQGLSGTWS